MLVVCHDERAAVQCDEKVEVERVPAFSGMSFNFWPILVLVRVKGPSCVVWSMLT